MTVKEKQQYTSTHLISALEAFREASNHAGDYRLKKIADGLLGLTMALQNIDDRLVVIEATLDLGNNY